MWLPVRVYYINTLSKHQMANNNILYIMLIRNMQDNIGM